MKTIGEWGNCRWPFSGRREPAFVCKVGRGKCYLLRHETNTWILCFSFGSNHDDSHSSTIYAKTNTEAKQYAKKNIVRYFAGITV